MEKVHSTGAENNMKNLKKIVSEFYTEWNKENFRPIKKALMLEAQERLNTFKKLTFDDYANNPIQVIDLFCGAGGTSLGFAAVNSVIPAFKFLGGCDINAVSAKTYSHNYGTTLLNRDILEIAYDNSKLDDFLKEINYNADMPLILIGCAPCQGFSSHRKKHWDEEDDNRNSLIIAFSKIVERIQADAILMENVPEFLSGKYWEYFSTARKLFIDNGYVVRQNIYNAASFGVPQERFRSIIIGMKKDFLLPEGYLDVAEFKTVRDAIGNLPFIQAGETCATDSMHKSVSHKKSTIEVIKQVPHDGGNRPIGVGPKCLDRTKGFSDVYGRLFWDKPSITITHYARNPASGRYIHPEQDRGLTAREAALLQSFPNGFEFTGKSDDIYRQIGEAVPPMLSTAVAADILVEVLSVQPTEEEMKNGIQSIEQPVSSSYSSVIAGIKMKRE